MFETQPSSKLTNKDSKKNSYKPSQATLPNNFTNSNLSHHSFTNQGQNGHFQYSNIGTQVKSSKFTIDTHHDSKVTNNTIMSPQNILLNDSNPKNKDFCSFMINSPSSITN